MIARPALALVAALLAPLQAPAGAWTKPEGEGVAILGIGREGAPAGMLTGRAPDGAKHSGQLYVEYGLSERVTLGAKLFADRRHDGAEARSAQAGGFARVRLWAGEASVTSVELGAAVPMEGLLGDRYSAPQPDNAAELSVAGLVGRSWWGDWGSAFLSSSWGYALRGEGAPGQVRSESTLGYKPADCCMAIVSLHGRYETPALAAMAGRMTGRAVPPVDGGASLKIAPSVAFRLPGGPAEAGRDRAFLQIGLSRELVDTGGGLGVSLSVWRTF
ncbi:MAG: hypothetical protein ACFBWO_04415 [Paracoccaceae bacterium]